MSWLLYLIWRSRPPWFHFPISVGAKQSLNVWRKKLSAEKDSNSKHKQINAWSFWTDTIYIEPHPSTGAKEKIWRLGHFYPGQDKLCLKLKKFIFPIRKFLKIFILIEIDRDYNIRFSGPWKITKDVCLGFLQSKVRLKNPNVEWRGSCS